MVPMAMDLPSVFLTRNRHPSLAMYTSVTPISSLASVLALSSTLALSSFLSLTWAGAMVNPVALISAAMAPNRTHRRRSLPMCSTSEVGEGPGAADYRRTAGGGQAPRDVGE